jgi:uncharacterized membrane protein
VTAKLNLGRLFEFKTLLGIFSPIVAVVMAFVVGAIIIVVFIKSLVVTVSTLLRVAEQGVPVAGRRLEFRALWPPDSKAGPDP